MEIIIIMLYFVIEAGFKVNFDLILLRKRCKIIIYFFVVALYNIIILCDFDIVVFCSFVCEHLSLFGYFSPFEFG